jgi:hypothetical protein
MTIGRDWIKINYLEDLKAMKMMFTAFLLLFSGLTVNVFSQNYDGNIKTNVLQSRRIIDGKDNYADATFSFEKGVNGEVNRKLTRNDWDLEFSSIRNKDGSIVKNLFGVTMVTDDCSRIKDLGEFDWSDDFEIPTLPAYEKPRRETQVEAIAGHIYLVHTKDTETDLYALFRVEELKNGESATISWKLIPNPEGK